MLKQSKTEYRATSSEECAEGTGNASGSFLHPKLQRDGAQAYEAVSN